MSIAFPLPFDLSMLEEDEEKGIINRIESLQQVPIWANTSEDFETKTILEITRLLNGLKKNTNGVINDENIKSFFRKSASSDEIYGLGHSLAEVDLPYFEKIASESPNARWYVSYYNDLKTIAENVCKIPKIKQVKFISLDELHLNRDDLFVLAF